MILAMIKLSKTDFISNPKQPKQQAPPTVCRHKYHSNMNVIPVHIIVTDCAKLPETFYQKSKREEH